MSHDKFILVKYCSRFYFVNHDEAFNEELSCILFAIGFVLEYHVMLLQRRISFTAFSHLLLAQIVLNHRKAFRN